MRMLDLLLINAPSREKVYGEISKFAAIETPVWAGLIAQYCLNTGFSVEILDAEADGLNIVETAQIIHTLNPHLAVFCVHGIQPSASTQCMPVAIAINLLLKQIDCNIKTMALGTHPSALPDQTLKEGFDFVCEGEGPYVITAVLKGLSEANNKKGTTTFAYNFQWPMGLWCLNNGSVDRSSFGSSPNVKDLDKELPGQAWQLLDMKKYRAHNWHLFSGNKDGGYASIQTSLGCPYACSFCCINTPFGGPGYRVWSPANVAVQIHKLVHVYGITNIKIADEMFVLNRQHVHQICNSLNMLRLGDKLNMWAYARVDTLKDEALLAHMRKAGIRWLGVGIESSSKHVRDGVEKGKFTDEDIVKVVERVRSHDISVAANYIFGLPDDTHATMSDTLSLAMSLNTEWANFYCTMAYPGSHLHVQAKMEGWGLPEDPGGPGWIGYSQHSYETFPLAASGSLSAAEILQFRDKAFYSYFSRSSYQDMLEKKFGLEAVKEIEKVLALPPLRRKLLEGKDVSL